MKKNKLEVMREARDRALESGVNFHTMNLAHPSGKKKGGNIIAAIQKLDNNLFDIGELGKFLFDVVRVKLYRIQYSFCSPDEKNPSRIFGEGQAALRFFNDKSALVLHVPRGANLSQVLKEGALEYAAIKQVHWLKNVTTKDLV
jgi:hypothetical protein